MYIHVVLLNAGQLCYMYFWLKLYCGYNSFICGTLCQDAISVDQIFSGAHCLEACSRKKRQN